MAKGTNLKPRCSEENCSKPANKYNIFNMPVCLEHKKDWDNIQNELNDYRKNNPEEWAENHLKGFKEGIEQAKTENAT